MNESKKKIKVLSDEELEKMLSEDVQNIEKISEKAQQVKRQIKQYIEKI